MHTIKTFVGTLSILVLGTLLFAPSVEAYINVEDVKRPSAPNREQEQIQLQLAERARNLADQYNSRRFGTGEEDPIVESVEDGRAERTGRDLPQRERVTSSDYSSADVQTNLASVRSQSVARNLPKLPGSGFGISIAALALGAAGALKGRKKVQ